MFAGVASAAAAGGNVSSASAPAARPGLPFAIADFDGDSRPDLARVETGPSNFTNAEYWIQLRLSAAGWQSIRLVAPVGGLHIAARDVNGDASLDLIVSTVWSNRPVAIYLNDGHGRFTHAEPVAFPGAFGESGTNLDSGVNVATPAAGVPPQSGAGIRAEETEFLHDRAAVGTSSASRAGFAPSAVRGSHSGRAPPFEVSSL